jgi:ribosome-associated translation inhibitor RaiA
MANIKRSEVEATDHIEFQGVEPTEMLRRAISAHIAALEKRFGKLTTCHVVLKAPPHHQTGGLYEVHVRLVLQNGWEVNAGRTPTADERHADVNFAINDSFKRAQRQLQDHARRTQGHVKLHEHRQ